MSPGTAATTPPENSSKTPTPGCGPNNGSCRRLSWSAVWTILLYGASLYSFGLVWPRTLTFHETIFAQPAREMVETGHWLVPMYARQVWDDKPPLTCWLIASAMSVFQSRHEAVVHLPNLLVTLVAAILIAMLTARWYGGKVGLLAGLVQLTTFYTLMQGRLAEADMPLGTLVLAAMTVFALANIPHPNLSLSDGESEEFSRFATRSAPWRWWMPILFYLFTGLAFLTKGPIGPAFIGLACGLYALWHWDRKIWRFLLDPLGWVVFLVLLLVWPLAAYRSNPAIATGWISNTFGRFAGQLADTGETQPWFFYFYMVPLMLLPWTPTLIWGLWSRTVGQASGLSPIVGQASCRSSSVGRASCLSPPSSSEVEGPKSEASDRYLLHFLLCWFVVGFVILCLSQWKAKHYSIPILFAATPVIAWRLQLDVKKLAQKAQAVLVGGFAAIWIVCVLVELLVQPHFDDYKYQAQLARRVNAKVPPGETIYFLTGDHRPHLAYYLERPMQVLNDQQALGEEIKQGKAGGKYVITQSMLLDWFGKLTGYEKLDKTEKLRPNENALFRQTLIRLSTPASAPTTQAR